MKTIEDKIKAFDKIIKVISSCKTDEHITSCRNLLNNYYNLFKKDIPDVKFDVEVFNEELHEIEKTIKKY